jgi:hypothetical protein
MYDRTKIHHPSAVHPRFNLGTVWVTQQARVACAPTQIRKCLDRHVRADWGVASGVTWDLTRGLASGRLVRSIYALDPARECSEVENCLWVVTARGETLVGLPQDFTFASQGTLVPSMVTG